MATTIGDLKAVLELQSIGADKTIADIQAIAKATERLAAQTVSDKLLPNTQAQRNSFKEMSAFLKSQIDSSVADISKLHQGFAAAGLPIGNLKALVSSLQDQISQTAKAVQFLSEKFMTAHSQFAKNPIKVVADKESGLLQLKGSGVDTALARNMREAWEATLGFRDTLTAANAKYRELLNSAQASVKIEEIMRHISDNVGGSIAALKAMEAQIVKTRDSVRGIYEAFYATSQGIGLLIGRTNSQLDAMILKSAEASKQAAAALTAAATTGAPRATAEAMALRKQAIIDMERERLAHAAATQQSQRAAEAQLAAARNEAILAEARRQSELAARRLAEAEAMRLAGLAKAATATSAGAAAAQAAVNAQRTQAAAAVATATAWERLRAALMGATTWTQIASALNSNLSGALGQVGQYAMLASGQVGALLGRMASLGIVTQGGLGLAALVGGLSAGVAGLASFASAAIRVERVLGPVRTLHMELAKTVGEDGVANFSVITDTMVKYGLSIEALSKPIARLKIATDGTILGGARFKSFLEDFAAVSSKFALPQEAIAGMAKAFEQMISKGTVQAEEFRQQLGDRLPAAARVGLETFRTLTGNANASFKDFMDAMKNRQLESTRFLDIFMVKLKEMFNVNNEATDNLNAAYGRLASQRDLTISKLDQAIGFTKMWGQALNVLSSALGGVGAAASVVGPAIQVALGVGALAIVGRIGAGLALVAGVTGAWGGVITGVRVALGALGTVGVVVFGKQLYDGATAFLERIGMIEKSVNAVGASGFKAAEFKIKYTPYSPDGKPLDINNPSILIAEIQRYLTLANDGLKSGIKFKADFDFGTAIDDAIAKIKAKTEQPSELKAVFFKSGGLKEYIRAYQDVNEKIVTLDENLSASLSKAAREGLNQRILAEKDLYDRAELAAQKRSASASAREILANRDSVARLENLRSVLARFEAEQSRRKEIIAAPPSTGYALLTAALDKAMPLLQNVGILLGGIAAVNLLGLAAGFGRVGNAVLSLGGRLTSVWGKIALIAGAAALFTAFSNPVKAAEDSIDGLVRRAEDLNKEILNNKDAFGKYGEVNSVLGDAKARAEILTQEMAKLRQELDAGGGVMSRSIGALEAQIKSKGGVIPEWFKSITGELNSADSTSALRARIEEIQGKLTQLQTVTGPLTEATKRMADSSSEAARALGAEGEAASTLPAQLKSAQDALSETRNKLKMLHEGGMELLNASDNFDRLWKTYGGGITDISAAAQAGNPELKRLVETVKGLARAQDELAESKKKLASEDKKNAKLLEGGDLSRAEGIIQRAEAIMDGMGSKMGTAVRQMIKDQRDYQNALIATGETMEAARAKSEAFRVALEMQAAGINMNTLQFKPFQAMQKGMETFSDKLAELMIKGDLTMKTFKEAARTMALSFVQDMTSMIIKMAVVKPLLESMFGASQGLTGMLTGALGASSGAATSGWATSVTPHATGTVVDGATRFMSGGKLHEMGEAGPEAIMPLTRGAGGRLGVAIEGGGKGGGDVALHITNNFNGNVGNAEVERLKAELPGLIVGHVRRAKRTGEI